MKKLASILLSIFICLSLSALENQNEKLKILVYNTHGLPEIFIDDNLVNNFITSFQQDNKLQYKDYIVTLLGYHRVPKHTNWYPWNRFLDVFKTIGYQCEWVDVNKIKRKNEKRIFITWNEPTCEELTKKYWKRRH